MKSTSRENTNASISTEVLESNMSEVAPTESKVHAVSEEDKVNYWFRKSCGHRHNILSIIAVLSVIVGFALGLFLRNRRIWSKRDKMYVTFAGELLLRFLNFLVVPLIVCKLVSGAAELMTTLPDKLRLRTVSYYLMTTIIAVLLGLLLAKTIQPGAGGDYKTDTQVATPLKAVEDSYLDLIRNMFPSDVIQAFTQVYTTIVRAPKSPGNHSEDIRQWPVTGLYTGGPNILGLVTLSLLFGFTLGHMGPAGNCVLTPFRNFFDALSIVTKFVIKWYAPIGIFSLVLGEVMTTKDMSILARQLALYIITIFVCFAIFAFVILNIIYVMVVMKTPFKLMYSMRKAMVYAYGTSSSFAVVPITLNCLEEENKIDPRICRRIVPLSAHFHMDGSTLYLMVAVVFISQFIQTPLSVEQQITSSVAAVAASIGSAGMPNGGIVMLAVMFCAIGINLRDCVFVIAFDYILDRFNAMMNVLGGAYACAIVAHLCAKELDLYVERSTSAAFTSSFMRHQSLENVRVTKKLLKSLE